MKLGDKCYFCNDIGNTKEHIPPKCIFPEIKDISGSDYRSYLICVPSCEEHNSKKSNDDEFLLINSNINTFSNNITKKHFDTKIKRIIEKYPKKIQKVLKNPQLVKINKNGQTYETIKYESNIPRLKTIFERMSYGLYLFHYQEYFEENSDLFYIDQVDIQKNIGEILQKDRRFELINLFQNTEKNGIHPEIFFYQLMMYNEYYIIRFVFHEEWNIFVKMLKNNSTTADNMFV